MFSYSRSTEVLDAFKDACTVTKDEATEGLIQPHCNMTCADVEFELGKSTNDQLALILDESRIIVLLISKAFLQSNKNLMEMNMAIDSHSER